MRLLTLLLALAGPAGAEVVLHDGAPVLSVPGQGPLTAGQAEALEDFSSDLNYFAAFFVDPVTGHHAQVSGFASRRAAELSGYHACRAMGGGPGCALHALVLPEGFETDRDGSVGFLTREMYLGRYAGTKGDPGFFAFAANGLWQSGWATGHATQAEATAAAMGACRDQMAADRALFDAAEWAALSAEGLTDCILREP